MRKFLSVLLALMMIVSTVSFAASSVVTTSDSATDAPVVMTEQETTDSVAELAADEWEHMEYGNKLFVIDLDGDTKYQSAELSKFSGSIDGNNDSNVNY